MQSHLPPLDAARSIRLWEAWGKQPKVFIAPKQYEQSVARKEPAPTAAPAVKVERKKGKRK